MDNADNSKYYDLKNTKFVEDLLMNYNSKTLILILGILEKSARIEVKGCVYYSVSRDWQDAKQAFEFEVFDVNCEKRKLNTQEFSNLDYLTKDVKSELDLPEFLVMSFYGELHMKIICQDYEITELKDAAC